MTLLMAPRQNANAGLVFIIEMIAIFAIFYFLLIRPQRLEQKRHRQMVANLKKGDEVITLGGIIGSVVHVKDDRVTIRTAEDTRLVIERSKIGRVATVVEKPTG
ncbi:MAG: preprotein translocase subunit YajC [Gemmatimonadetes bacterium]|nr:preprotein translocase subunit YajC [Gemmatimonadota bacterium]